MKNLLKTIALIAVSAILITSCSKENDASTDQEVKTEQNDKVLTYIKSLGFKDSQIVSSGDKYIVDGDIVFDKNMEVPVDNGMPKTEQYYNGNLVTAANNIRVKVDPSITSMAKEIDAAILMWNTVPKSKVKFVLTTEDTYDILIKVDNSLGSGVCGMAYLSTPNGKAGSVVWINQKFIKNNSFEQRTRTIAHEFGHTISFGHTNDRKTDIEVPGVGGADASSLMNGGQCGRGATVLSAKDKQATAVLYPLESGVGKQGADALDPLVSGKAGLTIKK